MLRNAPDRDSLNGLDGFADPRAAVLRAAQERAALRHSQIEAQASPTLTAQQRIQLWENLHALRLPVSPQHKLVRLIATHTSLSVAEVVQEQHRRAGADKVQSGS